MSNGYDAVRQQPVVLRLGNKPKIIVMPAGIYETLRLIERVQPICLKQLVDATQGSENKISNVLDQFLDHGLVTRKTQEGSKTYYYRIGKSVVPCEDVWSFTANKEKHSVSTTHRLNVLRLSNGRYITADATYLKIFEFIRLNPGVSPKPYKTREEARALSRPSKFVQILINADLVYRDNAGNLRLVDVYRRVRSAVIITSSPKNRINHEKVHQLYPSS